MAQAAAQYELGRAEFERALATLDREQQAMQLSRAQRLSHRLYTIFTWGSVICSVGLVIAAVLGKVDITLLPIELRVRLGQSIGITDPTEFILVIFLVGLGLCLPCAILALVLNISLLRKIIRHKVLFRRIGLSDSLEVVWKAHQKARRWRAIGEKVALGLGLLLLPCSVILWVRWINSPKRYLSGPGYLGVYSVLLFLGGVLLVMFYVLQSGKVWLDIMSSRWRDVTRLKESIVALETTAQRVDSGSIPVPVDVIEQFSQIETEQIERTRAIAISESLAASKMRFSVLSSDALLKVKAGLDPDDRLKVEETIDELMLQPRPSGVEKNSDADTLRQRVHGTDWEIVYVVDDAGRQLKLLSLRQSVIAERK